MKRKLTSCFDSKLPPCLDFLCSESVHELNSCLYYATLRLNMQDLCLIEGAILVNKITIKEIDCHSVLWFIFGSPNFFKSVVTPFEQRIFNKVFDILSNTTHSWLKAFLNSLHFYDINVVKTRGLIILEKCVLPRLTIQETDEWLKAVTTEQMRYFSMSPVYGTNEVKKLLKSKALVEFLYVTTMCKQLNEWTAITISELALYFLN